MTNYRLSATGYQRCLLNASVRYIREAGLTTPEEKLVWLRDLVGMVMEKENIPGTLATERIPIPDGYIVHPLRF